MTKLQLRASPNGSDHAVRVLERSGDHRQIRDYLARTFGKK
jgi:hypothetical protein